jgi:hypothetical protein
MIGRSGLRGRLFAVALLAAFLAACTSAATPTPNGRDQSGAVAPAAETSPGALTAAPVSSSTAAVPPLASGPATIRILSPRAGEAASGNRLEVRIEISGFQFKFEQMYRAPEPGVGHWHFYVDGKLAGMVASDVGSLPNDTMPEIAPGLHEIRVQLHNNDHTPVGPNDRVMVNFPSAMRYQAAGGPPSVKMVGPRNNDTVGPRVVIQVQTAGIKLDSINVGKPAVPGAGHWLLFVDGKVAALSASDVVSIPNDNFPKIAAGTHDLRVELRNNDGSPVAGASADEVKVTYKGG